MYINVYLYVGLYPYYALHNMYVCVILLCTVFVGIIMPVGLLVHVCSSNNAVNEYNYLYQHVKFSKCKNTDTYIQGIGLGRPMYVYIGMYCVYVKCK